MHRSLLVSEFKARFLIEKSPLCKIKIQIRIEFKEAIPVFRHFSVSDVLQKLEFVNGIHVQHSVSQQKIFFSQSQFGSSPLLLTLMSSAKTGLCYFNSIQQAISLEIIYLFLSLTQNHIFFIMVSSANTSSNPQSWP